MSLQLLKLAVASLGLTELALFLRQCWKDCCQCLDSIGKCRWHVTNAACTDRSRNKDGEHCFELLLVAGEVNTTAAAATATYLLKRPAPAAAEMSPVA